MVASIVAGMLATIGWKTAFGTYGITAAALIVFLICVSKQPLKENKHQSEETKKSKIPPVVFLWALGAVFIMATGYIVLNVFSQLIIGQNIGTVADVGVLSALIAVGTMTASFLFGFLFRALKKFILTVALTCIGFGFFVIANATGLPMMTLGILAVGLGLGMVNPTLISYAIKASPESPTLATSIICSGLFVGQFLSSVSINIIMAVTNSRSLNSLVFSTGVVIAAGVVVALIFAIRKKNEVKTAA
jgi:predicted MFS family arabinose efflux permease